MHSGEECCVAPDLKQTRRDPAQGLPDSAVRLRPGQESENALGHHRSDWAMKLFTGWILSAGLVVVTGAANAQMPARADLGRSPYAVVSDVDGPYAAMPPEADGPRYGYGPMLLPAPEVYTLLRENGFSPLGAPRQHGLFYTVAVVDRRGDDGRLVIDARNGRIIRFMPAGRMSDEYSYNDVPAVIYGRPAPMPPIDNLRGVPRPPAPVPPRMASRTPPAVPMPKAAPPRAADIQPEVKPLAPKLSSDKPSFDKSSSDKPASEPAQQSAAAQAKPADTPIPPPAAVPIVPAPQIQPTQAMPKVQGLE
jgi:hypothetical protein